MPHVMKDRDARADLWAGLADAAVVLCPRHILLNMADDDKRWDELTDLAVARILPAVAGILEAAVAAEWERSPFTVAPRRRLRLLAR